MRASRPELKWCSGICGRELPRSAFYKNSDGNEQGRCKTCHRHAALRSYRRRRAKVRRRDNERRRTRYATDVAYRENIKQRARAAYAARRQGQ